MMMVPRLRGTTVEVNMVAVAVDNCSPVALVMMLHVNMVAAAFYMHVVS